MSIFKIQRAVVNHDISVFPIAKLSVFRKK